MFDGACSLSNVASDDALFRRRFGGFIRTAGHDLKLDSVAIATATWYFQRFFAVESRESCHAGRIAIACLWLSTKVLEERRPLRDIVNAFTVSEGGEPLLAMEE